MSKITNNLVIISYLVTTVGLLLFLYGKLKHRDDDLHASYMDIGIFICMIGCLFHLVGNKEQSHAKNKTFTNSNIVYFAIILLLYVYSIKESNTFLKELCLFLFVVNQIIFSVAAYT